jgi:hypothetical protein
VTDRDAAGAWPESADLLADRDAARSDHVSPHRAAHRRLAHGLIHPAHVAGRRPFASVAVIALAIVLGWAAVASATCFYKITGPTAVLGPPSPANPLTAESVSLDGSGSHGYKRAFSGCNGGVGCAEFCETETVEEAVETYRWSFGDGVTQETTTPSVSHAYAAAGTYTVTLTVATAAHTSGPTTASVPVADRAPVAAFTVSASPAAGALTRFDASASFDPDGTVVNYHWAFGDGTIQDTILPRVNHVYAHGGSPEVALTVTDNSGSTGSTTQPISVGPALPPELGRCVKVPKGAGGYATGACHTLQSGGSYEWISGPGAEARFTVKGEASSLETVRKAKVTCKRVSGSGEYLGAKVLADVVIAFKECEVLTLKCSSSGASEGEVVTPPLEGVLGWASHTGEPAEFRVALDLFPQEHTGPFAVFKCGGLRFSIGGSVLGLLRDNTAPSFLTSLKYSQRGGRQRPEQFEGEAPDVLTASLEEGPPEQAGLAANATLINEERLEVNAFA